MKVKKAVSGGGPIRSAPAGKPACMATHERSRSFSFAYMPAEAAALEAPCIRSDRSDVSDRSDGSDRSDRSDRSDGSVIGVIGVIGALGAI